MKELKHLNKYFIKYKYKLVLGILITIVARVFLLFTPKLISASIDVLDKYLQGSITDLGLVKQKLFINIIYIIGAALLAGFFTFLMRQTLINMSRYIEYDLKNEIYKQYQKLSLGFYKSNRTGDLMNRISEDVSNVRMYVGPALMYSINTLTLFIIVIAIMYSQSPELTLYTAIPLPILSIVVYKLSIEIHKRSTVVQVYLSKLSSFAQESFSGISVIKNYAIEPQTSLEFKKLAETSKEKQLALVKVNAFFFPSMVLLIGLSNLIVIYIGGLKYIQGEFENIGIIAEFMMYVTMLTWPVASVGWVASLVQKAEASQKRINEFLKVEPSIKNKAEIQTNIEGDITFNNITFTYPDTNITALNNLSFSIKKGKTLAIIGKTGAGKSTILELIGRLYDVKSGKLYIDDTSIEKVHLASLRNSIGYVPQDAFLFSDSIKSNIKFGKEDATEDEIITAAKNAQVHKNIIQFADAYDTVLGERGITLSGGQKQRVSIARALIKDPSILLFDDCLSAVDTETEEKILNRLNALSKNKTTLIVSHRISSIKHADTIIVLEAGKIIQEGTHNTLINIDGYYKNLYLKQISEKEK